MMAYGGLRLGEALSVRLRNIDFNRMTLHVAESYKTHRFKKPKFGKTRLADLPDYLVQKLSAYVKHLQKEGLRSGQGSQVDRLFVDPLENGSWPYSQRKMQGLMRKVSKQAGLERRHPHDLRHTYATILLMAHQSPGYVQKQLGHSSISITMDIYCHWIPGEGRKGLENALLGNRSAQKVVPNWHILAYKQKRSQ